MVWGWLGWGGGRGNRGAHQALVPDEGAIGWDCVERRRYGSATLDAGQYSELPLARVDICRYHRRMPDVLIRDLPAEDLARLDAHAARQGLSRTEYLRRRLREDAARVDAPVAVSDLERFAERFGDLEDPEVMRQAWS